MHIRSFVYIALLVIFFNKAFSQGKAMTFQEAAQQGNSYQHLDSLYKSAVHTDEKLAVFKTPEEQEQLQKAYIKFIQSIAAFLKENRYQWGKETRCFNRIYISADGTVDYFLYNFSKDQLSPEKEKEFRRLLNEFIKTTKFPLTAKEKFAQCSPVKYVDL